MPSPHSPTDAPNHYWTAEVNDIVGGWIATNAKLPLSQMHQHVWSTNKVGARCTKCDLSRNSPNRLGSGERCKADYMIAWCDTERDAIIIASTLNRAGVRRP